MPVRHVFGPVPSRRLGISLGVDIIPYKTCTLDCIYCECGPSTSVTLKRQRFVDPDLVFEEIKDVLNRDRYLDYITFSGSGEPTLSSDLGLLIKKIRDISSTPIAVLTNGTLLHLGEVRGELSGADLVLPSLDACSPEIFQRINHPHGDLSIAQIIRGLKDFRASFTGRIWLEVFIIRGVNDHPGELDRLFDCISGIGADKIQLNSLDRPPAYEGIEPIDRRDLERIKDDWHGLPVEVIKRVACRQEILSFSRNLENNILNTINRRPLTIDDLQQLTGKNRLELFKYVDILLKEGKVSEKIVAGKIFLTPADLSSQL